MKSRRNHKDRALFYSISILFFAVLFIFNSLYISINNSFQKKNNFYVDSHFAGTSNFKNLQNFQDLRNLENFGNLKVEDGNAGNYFRGLSELGEDIMNEVVIVVGEDSKQECAERYPDDCTGGGNFCSGDEALEFSCCLNVDSTNMTSAETCFTKSGKICPYKDLCVAELIPASNIGAECLTELDKTNGVLIYTLAILYLFLALAIVCDDYFTYSLDQLARILEMSSDVKGATFAAIGSSAPEFFVSLADNVLVNPPKSVGVGTIVGSAIFNILVINGVSAMFAGIWFGYVKVDWRPILRDSVFYSLSIGGLALVAVTGNKALYYEGLALLGIYALYLVFMYYNTRIFRWLHDTCGHSENPIIKAIEQILPEDSDDTEKAKKDIETLSLAEKAAEDGATEKKNNVEEEDDDLDLQDGACCKTLAPPSKTDDVSIPRYVFSVFYYLLTLPISLLFTLTIPDSRFDVFHEDRTDKVSGLKVQNKRHIAYWTQFICCVIHIAILSHLLVFSAAKFGCLTGVAPSVMGLTVLAAGTSVPDLLTSVFLTRQGEADAAIANSLGSNVFDILVGLGFPWFVAGLLYGQAEIETDDIVISMIFLAGVLIVFLLMLWIGKLKLNFVLGFILTALYGFYIVFELTLRERYLNL